MAADDGLWLRSLRRYCAASAVGHVVWEVLQLPLYTIWYGGTSGEIAFAVVHCTGGDLLIAGATFLLALMAFGRNWPGDTAAFSKVALTVVALGLGYTIFSEWLNVSIRQSWSYSPWMPRLPVVGTGLSPMAQWIVVPLLSFRWARAPQAR